MSGFRKPELSRDQIVLWSQQLEDAIPLDHPVRLFDQLLHAEPFAATFREWERDYVLVEGQPPYHPRVSKWSGLRELARRTGVRDESVWAVGDQVNDLPMIRGAGVGVAMGNAMEKARSAADRVIGDCNSDAIAGLLDELF